MNFKSKYFHTSTMTCSKIFFLYKIFVLGIIMQLDILDKLTPQLTTIICHHMEKSIIKKKKTERKYKNMGGLDQKLIC